VRMESRAGILPATAYCVPKLCTKDKPRESREPPAVRQSQRDCVFSPGLRGTSYPGCQVVWVPTPRAKGVVSPFPAEPQPRWPLGLFAFGHLSQGSSFLATLGFESESLWDSRTRFPKGIMPCPAMTAPHHADLISRPALRRWGRLEARPTLFGTPYELREHHGD